MSFRRSWQQGEQYVWATAAAVCITLLMVALLVAVILVNGLGFFWPADLAQVRLTDGSVLLGEVTAEERATASRPDAVQFKVGNRDLYGQDFRWVPRADLGEWSEPADAVHLEREEFGNFYGFLSALQLVDVPDDPAAEPWARFEQALAAVRARHAVIADSQEALGSLSRRSEALRLRLAKLRYQDAATNGEAIRRLQAQLDLQGQRFERRNQEISEALGQLRRNIAVFADAAGRPKAVPLTDVVRAVRPNRMGVGAKLAFYGAKLVELVAEDPRESNTEGGLYPAIFGTVLLVLIMSVFALPLGVVTAIYLREYAREGILVRLVRIAVYNLAGVPSIVFGVFGLGFFVYGLGAGMDNWFFPERLPTPTFGTGGILWASLTLSLLTVPVVIVATEEGLTAIPRGIREASLALGATRFQTLVRVVMPMAVPGMITGFVLAVARAAGEVAPLMITGVVKLAPTLPLDGVFPYLHLDRKFMHLGFHIYDVGFQSPNVEAAKPMVYITTLLLVGIVIVLSITAIVLRNYMRKRFRTATF